MVATAAAAIPASSQRIGRETKRAKRPAFLTLPLHDDYKSNIVLEVNLGSPFKIHDDSFAPAPSPLSFGFTVPSFSPSSSPLIFTASFYDDIYESYMDSDDSDVEEADDVQVISIPSTSRFYTRPPPSQSAFSPWVQGDFDEEKFPAMSFACDALVPKTQVRSPAELFHEELDQVLPLLSTGFSDMQCMHGMDMQLYSSPVQVFQEICLDSLNPLPDYPVDYDSESEDDTEPESKGPVNIICQRPASLAPLLDRRLVAPFESQQSIRRNPNRDTCVPANRLCGLRVAIY